MFNKKFYLLLMIFSILFLILTYSYYDKTREMAIENAHTKINELLVNYKAFRTYVSTIQKQEVYRLQAKNQIECNYFRPQLLSSTFSARSVNDFYNILREEKGQKPILIRFASNNPRNTNNKATKDESKILQQFNDGTIKNYSKIIKKDDQKSLYYAIPTKKTTKACMKCHSNPSLAPKGLIEIYGDKNGFYEQVGKVRALLSTTYPLDEDYKYANDIFIKLTIITFVVFSILLFIVYNFAKKINIKNDQLEELNKTLDKKVIDRTKELVHEKSYVQTILDNSTNIIIVTTGDEIISANKRFFDFFKYETLEQFKLEHNCICDYFNSIDERIFPKDKLIDGESWCNYLIRNNDTVHNLTLEIDKKPYNFTISADYLLNHDEIIMTLNNVSDIKQKDKLLFEQSKLASMGEMIGNIAHQWRQPLSIISTGATGLKVKKEFNDLDDKFFFDTCDMIDENAQYLSKTIDDFKSFIKGDRKKETYNLQEKLDNFTNLTKPTAKSNNITLIINIKDDINIIGYPNELIQCLLNIFNNAKDAFVSVKENERFITIDARKEDDYIIIDIQDNAGGIPKDIIHRIFEPYFTTKHQSQGTGLGLHMTYNIIIQGMKGTIGVKNISVEHNDKTYTGACFTIKLPFS